jgi:hypothetical protein
VFEPTAVELLIAARRERALVLLAHCHATRRSAERTRRRSRWLVPKARFVRKQVRARLAAMGR